MADLSTAGVRGAASWTASDTAVVSNAYPSVRGVWVGTTGNLAVTFQDGSEVTFNSVPVGMFPLINPKYIKSTGTTASNLVVVW